MVEENKGAGEGNYKCTPYLHKLVHLAPLCDGVFASTSIIVNIAHFV